MTNQNVTVYFKSRSKSQQSSEARKSVQSMQNDKACKTARKVKKAEIEVLKMVILSPEQSRLKGILDRILDKGVVVDANVRVNLAGTDLIGINARTILSSFKTAAETGLDLPKGTNFDAPGWRELITKQPCPICGMKSKPEDLKEEGCPWCGWNYRPDGR